MDRVFSGSPEVFCSGVKSPLGSFKRTAWYLGSILWSTGRGDSHVPPHVPPHGAICSPSMFIQHGARCFPIYHPPSRDSGPSGLIKLKRGARSCLMHTRTCIQVCTFMTVLPKAGSRVPSGYSFVNQHLWLFLDSRLLHLPLGYEPFQNHSSCLTFLIDLLSLSSTSVPCSSLSA